MQRRNETVFLPDLIQPGLLDSAAARRLVVPGTAIAVGVVAFVVFGFSTSLGFATISSLGAGRPNAGPVAGVLGGLAAGLACGAQCLRRTIEPTHPPQRTASALGLSVLRTLRWIIIGATVGGALGWWFGSMDAQHTLGTVGGYVVVGVCGQLLGGAAGGALLGILISLAVGIVHNLRVRPNIRPALPGIGMRDTLRVSIAAGAVTVLIGTIAYGLLFGLPLGTLVALRIGGGAYLRHHVLRALLARENKLPRQPLKLLHHAHTHGLLSEIGGGYKFTHPLLRDYFATLDTISTSDSAGSTS